MAQTLISKARRAISRRIAPLAAAIACVVITPVGVANAQVSAQSDAGFQPYLQSLWPKASAMGISRSTFDRVIAPLTPNPRVVALDRSQADEVQVNPNAPISPFAPYYARHVDANRIAGGQTVIASEAAHLRIIERADGVPAPIIVGIYGHETNYGRITGNFDILRSLATLAYEGRRRSLFEDEFLAAMKMVEQGAPPSALTGSWAGAIGHPQFLPSVYLRMARDGDGDGVAAIWNNRADALASIAHYLAVSGYQRGEHWGYAVRVPGSLDRASIATRLASPRCARVFQRHSRWLTADEWRNLGVSFSGRQPANGDELMTLLEPDGPGQTAYLLTGSYRSILDYNCSNFYALSVGLLGDAVAQR